MNLIPRYARNGQTRLQRDDAETPVSAGLLGRRGGEDAAAVLVGVAALDRLKMPERRFPPPWSVEEPDPKLGRQWCYIVRDANGHALAYVYFEEEPAGERRRD